MSYWRDRPRCLRGSEGNRGKPKRQAWEGNRDFAIYLLTQTFTLTVKLKDDLFILVTGHWNVCRVVNY